MVVDFTQGKQKYHCWSKDGALWYFLYRTIQAGAWNEDDRKAFNACPGHYLIYFDHTKDGEARYVANYLMQRFDQFVAAKVSKFARDGEKILCLMATSDNDLDSLRQFCKAWGMYVHRYKLKTEAKSEHQKQADATWARYITCLAAAFKKE